MLRNYRRLRDRGMILLRRMESDVVAVLRRFDPGTGEEIVPPSSQTLDLDLLQRELAKIVNDKTDLEELIADIDRAQVTNEVIK